MTRAKNTSLIYVSMPHCINRAHSQCIRYQKNKDENKEPRIYGVNQRADNWEWRSRIS